LRWAPSIATALLFGIAPAWSASTLELVPALKASMEGESRRRVTLSNVLVVGQLSLSLVLLVAGALLARGLVTAKATDLGYDPRQVSLLSFNLQMNGYDVGRATAFRERALSALRALPGVTAVSTASRLPLSPDINMDSILVQGHHVPGDDGTLVDAAAVGADYFRVVGVLIVAGRAFTEDDVRQKRKVAVVNETLARQYWPDGSAVGRQIYTGTFASVPFEIVGVARDHKVRSVGEDPRPYLHVPESPDQQIGLIARTVTPAAAALPMFREALWALEPHILFTEDTTAEHVAATTVALGALAAAGVARVLDSLLYGVSGLDPAAYGAAAGVLLLVALGANLVPAVSAARVDPVRALRNE
jgi:putative ABC transport system permease protein